MWGMAMKDLYDQVKFDGVWLTENEPHTLCNGECPSQVNEQQEQEICFEPQPELGFLKLERRRLLYINDDKNTTFWYTSIGDQKTNNTYMLPFIPGYQSTGYPDNETLSLNATTNDTGQGVIATFYNVHSVFGRLQQRATDFILGDNKYFTDSWKRRFVLSRSTFPSSGTNGGHFTGSIMRDWDAMKYSIASLMNFNMFGIQMTGAEVCGFQGKATNQDEICGRWTQLATFYPFARSFYNVTANDTGKDEVNLMPSKLKDPYMKMATNAIKQRYQFLRLLYSCLK